MKSQERMHRDMQACRAVLNELSGGKGGLVIVVAQDALTPVACLDGDLDKLETLTMLAGAEHALETMKQVVARKCGIDAAAMAASMVAIKEVLRSVTSQRIIDQNPEVRG